jgi:CheY-like chemotaxis protein
MTRHILVVDDEPTIRAFIREALRDEGYVVTTAANGRVALDAIAQGCPDVLVLDLQMPVMSGWQVGTHLLHQGSTIPIVCMTASLHGRTEAARCGAREYLAKPFDLDDLISAVARCCG